MPGLSLIEESSNTTCSYNASSECPREKSRGLTLVAFEILTFFLDLSQTARSLQQRLRKYMRRCIAKFESAGAIIEHTTSETVSTFRFPVIFGPNLAPISCSLDRIHLLGTFHLSHTLGARFEMQKKKVRKSKSDKLFENSCVAAKASI